MSTAYSERPTGKSLASMVDSMEQSLTELEEAAARLARANARWYGLDTKEIAANTPVPTQPDLCGRLTEVSNRLGTTTRHLVTQLESLEEML